MKRNNYYHKPEGGGAGGCPLPFDDIYEFKHILIRVNEKKFVTSNSGRKCVLFSNADFTVFESDDQISGWDK